MRRTFCQALVPKFPKGVTHLLGILAIALLMEVPSFAADGPKQKGESHEPVKAEGEPREPEMAEPANSPREGTVWGGYPVFQATSDTGLTVGAFADRMDYGTPTRLPFKALTSFGGSYTTSGSRYVLLSHDQTGFTDWDLRIRTGAYALVNPYEPFYGFGEDAELSPELERQGVYHYQITKLSIFTTGRKKISEKTEGRLSVVPVYLMTESRRTHSEYQHAYGSNPKKYYWTALFAGLIRDDRNFEYVAYEGSFLETTVVQAPSFLGSTPWWFRWDFDVRKYVSLIPERWLYVASQFRYTGTTPDTPLTEKATLGGPRTLRGYRLNRFTSDHSITLRAELRSIFLRSRWFDFPFKGGGALFVDTGRVANRWLDLFKNSTHMGWGFTLLGSYFSDDYVGRLDIGFSKEGTTFFAGGGMAF